MTESKHTPGPWKTDSCAYVRSQQDCLIADVRDGTDGEDFDVAEANARLIAAALEMLDALKRILAPASGVKKLPAWVYGIAGPAIAKAEGRS